MSEPAPATEEAASSSATLVDNVKNAVRWHSWPSSQQVLTNVTETLKTSVSTLTAAPGEQPGGSGPSEIWERKAPLTWQQKAMNCFNRTEAAVEHVVTCKDCVNFRTFVSFFSLLFGVPCIIASIRFGTAGIIATTFAVGVACGAVLLAALIVRYIGGSFLSYVARKIGQNIGPDSARDDVVMFSIFVWTALGSIAGIMFEPMGKLFWWAVKVTACMAFTVTCLYEAKDVGIRLCWTADEETASSSTALTSGS
eukprot:TRINITY_DN76078_c0_g1_i1.p1 TRINITY_DN76078_c0_g1~~TRINITY_DN76078_c0_g1_i1.p1  ORF type:complete len:276 (+),score=37.56 TRINITY_DN76078_c0_g1_i1:72-830(+)